ncbi:hypothetical protein F4808DRAFT_474712 [Astrocystis sublimbata]|nr:hypothetical protein F4808DRAFT_474712 [Astrocystis sublimbata]
MTICRKEHPSISMSYLIDKKVPVYTDATYIKRAWEELTASTATFEAITIDTFDGYQGAGPLVKTALLCGFARGEFVVIIGELSLCLNYQDACMSGLFGPFAESSPLCIDADDPAELDGLLTRASSIGSFDRVQCNMSPLCAKLLQSRKPFQDYSFYFHLKNKDCVKESRDQIAALWSMKKQLDDLGGAAILTPRLLKDLAHQPLSQQPPPKVTFVYRLHWCSK